MKLIKRKSVGEGSHHSGWPVVMKILQKFETGDGPLLDDFTDATFTYLGQQTPHTQPWVGIFHHPVTVDSPLADDVAFELRRLDTRPWPYWRQSKPTLKGAIGLCDEVTRELSDWLKVPTLSLLHPIDPDVSHWREDVALQNRHLLQVGYCLRNTQLIFQLDIPSWTRGQLSSGNSWYDRRDEVLRKRAIRPDVKRTSVVSMSRLSNDDYDNLLTSSVVIMELFGAAANNVTIECMVRGTPLIVNRLPSVEQYLGKDYPLFYSRSEDLSKLAELLTPVRLRDAHQQLLERAKRLPTFTQFAADVAEFVDSF